MGPRPKGVYITGEALRSRRKLAIGETTINTREERIVDDAGSDQIEVSNYIPFGKINIFVGMVYSTRSGMEESAYESVSGAATMAQSDGEESVGTTEIDLPVTAQEAQSDDPAWAPRKVIEDDEESILEQFEDRYGYGIEEEEYELSPGPIRRVGVYTTPTMNLDPASISAAATTTADALAQNQQNQQN